MNNVINNYTQEQGREDGIFVKIGSCGDLPVVFTSNLFKDGYEDEIKCMALVKQGLSLLRLPDKEDSPYMRLRVIEEGKTWVIANDKRITFLKPEDYYGGPVLTRQEEELLRLGKECMKVARLYNFI